MEIIVFFDGACRGNGTKHAVCGCGYTVNAHEGNEHEGNKFLGSGTNNTAEYSGLIGALETVISLYGTDVHVKAHGDSKLIIEQMKGRWKIKAENLIAYNKKAKELSNKFKSIEFIHVERSLNSKADKLANKSLDS